MYCPNPPIWVQDTIRQTWSGTDSKQVGDQDNMPAAVFIISQNESWAAKLGQLCKEEKLASVAVFPMGKGSLAAYRKGLPEVVIFDMRTQPRDVAVAMAMIREIYPNMASGGVCVIGHADPGDTASVQREREQVMRVPMSEYMPSNTALGPLVERLRVLIKQAGSDGDSPGTSPVQEPAAPAVPAAEAEAETAVEPALEQEPVADVPCQLKLLLADGEMSDSLVTLLGDLGAERLDPATLDKLNLEELPPNLVVDASSAAASAAFLRHLRDERPAMRVAQLPDNSDSGIRRLAREVTTLLAGSQFASDPVEVARLLRRWVALFEKPADKQTMLLLVEDEQNIRELTAHYLLLQGYEVYQAEDGIEAMSVFRARRPSMVLTDVYMPRMNGFKLLLEVKSSAPDMPILLMTGYNSAAQVLSTSKYRDLNFLPKPFRLSELGEKIRGVLGGAA